MALLQSCFGFCRLNRVGQQRNAKYRQQVNSNFLWDDDFPVAADGVKAPRGSTLQSYTSQDGTWKIRPARSVFFTQCYLSSEMIDSESTA